MKNVIVLFCLLSGANQLLSQESHVTKDEAITVANSFRTNLGTAATLLKCDILQIQTKANTRYYEVKYEDGMNVLVAASKNCMPIIGFFEGEKSIAENDRLPCGLAFLMSMYDQYLDYVSAYNVYDSMSREQWNVLLRNNSTRKGMDSVRSLSHLIKTEWGQSFSNDSLDTTAYNFLIPSKPTENACKCYMAGCVAVAMAQIMNFWTYPVLLEALPEQIDWCSMPARLLVSDPSYKKQKTAVAKLILMCGESVDMRYGCSLSLAYVSDAEQAFRKRFNYTRSTYVTSGLYEMNFEQWKNNVIQNVRDGRPVLVGASRSSAGYGHAFLCDGYNESINLFHFNFGWNGEYNGFYAIPPIVVGDAVYDYGFTAIVDIVPSLNQSICDIHLQLDDFYRGSSSGLPATPHTMTTLTSASASSPAAWRTIPAGASAEYVAHEEVILEDGFEAEWGSEFEARIEPCAKCDGTRGEASAHGLAAHTEADQPNDTAAKRSYSMAAPDAQLPQAELYPNPTDGPLFMPTDGMATAVLVYDLMGRPVGGWHLSALTETGVDLDVSALRPGAYLLAVQTEAGTKTARFVRK